MACYAQPLQLRHKNRKGNSRGRDVLFGLTVTLSDRYGIVHCWALWKVRVFLGLVEIYQKRCLVWGIHHDVVKLRGKGR